MKAKLITAGVVLAVMLALCWYAMWAVQSEAEVMRNLATRATAACANEDYAGAEALLSELQQHIDEQRARLEVLALHEDLNEISAAAAEARIRVRYQQKEEFQVAMARVMEALTLLDERQMLTWSNLF